MKKLMIDTVVQCEFGDPGKAPPKITMSEIYIEVLRRPPNGADLELMSEISPVLRKLKRAIEGNLGFVYLENHEHKAFLRCINGFIYRTVDPAVSEVLDSLNDLEDVEMEEKK